MLQMILGNQLFPVEYLPASDDAAIFMAEDLSLCTYVRHHKKKLILFLSAMRNYADELKQNGFEVRYHALDDDNESSYEAKLSASVAESNTHRLRYFEVEDKFMEKRIADWARAKGIETEIAPSPMFLCSRERFSDFMDGCSTPRMATFYRLERQRLGLLLDDGGSPQGGRWSLDTENRKKLPADVDPPALPKFREQPHVAEVTRLVEARFPDHPGSSEDFWLPVTRDEALAWLEDFIKQRLASFGPYEDAITQRSIAVFHSVLSPSLNLGLITPQEVIERVVSLGEQSKVPLNSLEGFVRQVIGWREFVRGIYRTFSERQETGNFWRHERRLASSWYEGDTGIPPLDDAIRNAWRFGWEHHIVRLMVVGNLMTLCEIEPRDAYRWFMEMYVDSADWVMGPNVYGMALFSDGGIFATKPYICGSNYLLKMSDYQRGDWCDIVDGLYWRFVDKHTDFFASNPRLAMMPRSLARLKPERKSKIFSTAEQFLQEHTRC